MYTSSIIATFISLLALTSASPSARSLKARSLAVVDVLVQSSPLSAATVQASAIQVLVGAPLDPTPNLKVCIGNNGFSPCQASKLSISPFGNTTSLSNVECQGFSDAEAEHPATGIFTVDYPAFLSTTGTRDVSVVICDFVH